VSRTTLRPESIDPAISTVALAIEACPFSWAENSQKKNQVMAVDNYFRH
jgi:hypothetical protein